MAKNTQRIVNAPFGQCCLKNERIDEEGIHWCEIYGGENYDEYIADCCCSMDDDEEIIYEQIDEILCL